jgi:hypothetical protein
MRYLLKSQYDNIDSQEEFKLKRLNKITNNLRAMIRIVLVL